MLSLVKKNLYKTVLSFIVLVLKKNLSMGGGGGLINFMRLKGVEWRI